MTSKYVIKIIYGFNNKGYQAEIHLIDLMLIECGMALWLATTIAMEEAGVRIQGMDVSWYSDYDNLYASG